MADMKNIRLLLWADCHILLWNSGILVHYPRLEDLYYNQRSGKMPLHLASLHWQANAPKMRSNRSNLSYVWKQVWRSTGKELLLSFT